jgi:ABC-2 type transport system permease protein
MTTSPAINADKMSPTGHQAINPAVRTSRAGACLALYWLTLRQHLHGKRWMAVALLFCVPTGIAILVRSTSSDTPSRILDFVLSWILIPQALLPLIALLYASGIVQDEQEEQTITYLLIRPIPKWLLYLTKMAATWTTTVVLVVVLTILTYAGIYVATGADLNVVAARCFKAAAILSLATITYCSIFGAMSLVIKRTLIVGILYTAIVEGVLATLPLSLRLMTVVYYTRLIAYRSLDFVVTWPLGQTEDPAAGAWSLDIKTDPTLAEHPQVLTCVLVLLGTSFVCNIFAAWLCSQREFHVKTPEKQ